MEQKQATRLFETLEMPLVPVLAEMEMEGVALDVDYLRQMSGELNIRLLEIEDQVYQAVGEPFNLNSPQQLSTALFDRLRISPPDRTQKTSSGFYSTSADILEGLRGAHPAVDWVLEYRELSKLKSTYLDALPLQVNPETGRVHTSFNQTGSVTGRLASSDPNLQNIPIRTEIGRRVRNAFVASKGHYLLGVDYSQIELRIVAHMAEDQAMLEAFRSGKDIHAATAAAIYGMPLEKVRSEAAQASQGGELWADLWDERVWVDALIRVNAGRSGRFCERLFQAVPGRQTLSGWNPQAGDGTGLCRDTAGTAAIFSGFERAAPISTSAAEKSAKRSTPQSRGRRRIS